MVAPHSHGQIMDTHHVHVSSVGQLVMISVHVSVSVPNSTVRILSRQRVEAGVVGRATAHRTVVWPIAQRPAHAPRVYRCVVRACVRSLAVCWEPTLMKVNGSAKIGQALESVGNGWESAQSALQRLISSVAEGEIPQSAPRGITDSAAEDTSTRTQKPKYNLRGSAPFTPSDLPEITMTSEDYALVRRLLNDARQILKTTHKYATTLFTGWFPLF